MWPVLMHADLNWVRMTKKPFEFPHCIVLQLQSQILYDSDQWQLLLSVSLDHFTPLPGIPLMYSPYLRVLTVPVL